MAAELAGAAERRRVRRLRSWLRHERQTVAMVLAEACHHFFGCRQAQMPVMDQEDTYAVGWFFLYGPLCLAVFLFYLVLA